MAFPNLNEITSTTLRSRTGKLANNVTRNNAILMRLSEKGKIKPFSGGRTIVHELEFAENQTYRRYSGYETLDISPSDVFTAADFDIKQAAVAVSISGLEMLQNSGKEAIIDLLESRISNAERTMKNNISTDIYSDGSADGGKQIGGLRSLVSVTPSSGTVGGINAANWAFWRNRAYGAVTDGGAAVTSANIGKYMRTLYTKLVRGADRPDLIVADDTMWGAYHDSLVAIQRIMPEKSAMSGFQTLKFMDADVVLDGGFNSQFVGSTETAGGAPSGYMYMLNTDYLMFRPHKERNMVPLDPDRFAVNQDAMVKLIGFAGNLTVGNRFLQGVLYNG